MNWLSRLVTPVARYWLCPTCAAITPFEYRRVHIKRHEDNE